MSKLFCMTYIILTGIELLFFEDAELAWNYFHESFVDIVNKQDPLHKFRIKGHDNLQPNYQKYFVNTRVGPGHVSQELRLTGFILDNGEINLPLSSVK